MTDPPLTAHKSTKTCTECGQERIVPDDFPKDRRNKDGVFGCCRGCLSKRSSVWQAEHPERVHDFRRARYNIDFNVMWEQQQGLCAMCGEPMLPRGRGATSVAIDHDHNCCPGRLGTSCGKCVRGLIHGRCNRLLGIVEKNANRIMRAEEYLARWRARLS